MKKIIALFAVVGALVLASCGGKKGNENTDNSVPAGWIALDLSKYGKNLVINVPDTTIGPLPLTVDNSTGEMIHITVGKDFQVDIKEGEGNMDMKKTVDIQKNEVYTFDKYLVDTADAIIYTWHMNGKTDDKGQPVPEYGVFAIKKIGNVTYEIESSAGEIFTDAGCKKMLESARSLREKPAEKKPAA